jgi:serine/threonine protein phosphatase PrpC
MAQPAANSLVSANTLNADYQKQVEKEQRKHGYQWTSTQAVQPDNKVSSVAAAALVPPSSRAAAPLPDPVNTAPAMSHGTTFQSVIDGAKRASFTRYVTFDEDSTGMTTTDKLRVATSLAGLDGLTAQEKDEHFRAQAEQRMKEGLDSVAHEFGAPPPTPQEYTEAYAAIPAAYAGPDAVADKAFDGAGAGVKAIGNFTVDFNDADPKAQATDLPFAVHQIIGGRSSQDDAYLMPTEIRFAFRGKELTATMAGVFDGSGVGSIRLAQFFANHLPSCVAIFLERLAPVDKIEDAIPQALTSAFDYLSNAYKKLYPTSCDLSTAVCVLKFGSQLYCANSGDSRALLVKKDSYIPLNASDTMQNPLMRKLAKAPVEMLNKNGQPYNGQGDPVFRARYSFMHTDPATAKQVQIHGCHEVGRLVGTISDLCSLPPVITLNDSEDGDVLLLSSDGLFPGAATLKQGADAVREGIKTNTKLSCITEKMTTAVSAAWKSAHELCDNTTVMIWRL